MSYADKLRRGINKACIPSYVTSAWSVGALRGLVLTAVLFR
ncbi:hypothetical protein R69658_08150 [Paraburkholderia aspalathi]|uniref:Uncharacterized protein n=1 Tax=Paraburkholderia aspalathi TaxID=1324617 RepID=A0ABN7NE32_9BURK|nr:hypothetical protein R69658_08150 [Paraburkholderia aspalathi]